ncbi:hypothetical protein PF002_g20652 [Phytophthora fragariae]|uniref:Uncharacterized protein n=2 Tax=Phytophthora fragariae TaxID=53985 RepID=A0A6A3XNF8_9STRA|nr:hypothetical protein PF002_g20652 [Phytophthora fragariae]
MLRMRMTEVTSLKEYQLRLLLATITTTCCTMSVLQCLTSVILELVATTRDAQATLAMSRSSKSAQKLKRKQAFDDDEASTDSDDTRGIKTARTSSRPTPTSSTNQFQRPLSRKPTRRTKTWESREKMKTAHVSVDNIVPELPQKTFSSWKEFEAARRSYEAKHFLCYRVRSSESAEKYNSRPDVSQLPAGFGYYFRRMWCTHAPRGEGRRDKDSRYTGCEAGYLVRSEEVISDGQAKWQVCVVPGTEISTHNHKTNKIIYDSYRGAKSMPLPPQVRKELGLLKQVNTSTANINRYLSNKLGGCMW